ncbi:MAG: CapA family protein, partial [Gammaproteobacteria bacterium]|nr:CapA family protein [Gammaproteobacteria bacterium]
MKIDERKTLESTQPKSVVLALAGDAMLGRAVAREFDNSRRPALFSAELEDTIRSADLFVLNLECCISSRGERWPAPNKAFFFRAPPETAEFLADIGVDCVTLANNHALDFGAVALLDTLDHLSRVDIQVAGAGGDIARARAPALIECDGFQLAVLGITDHPSEFSAGADRAGVAFVDLRNGEIPPWLLDTLASSRNRADAVLLCPHWGPNLTARPPAHVRQAASVLREHATLIAGHSAHVFHGVEHNVLYDLGDLVNDYTSVRPSRNILLGILNKLGKEASGVTREAVAAARSRP